jgi:calcineurin-like phosphoesterase family protein
MRYFTSDTHFFHQQLLMRPQFAPYRQQFFLMQQLHDAVIAHWNARVTDQDMVYHLGDIAVHLIKPMQQSHADVHALLVQLHGKIVFVKGNHDTRSLFKYLAAHNPLMPDGEVKFYFEDVGVYFKMAHHQFYLTHYPMMLGVNDNLVNLHGHIHHAAVSTRDNLNVGIDSPELAYLADALPFGAPMSEADILAMLAAKQVDYQKRR